MTQASTLDADLHVRITKPIPEAFRTLCTAEVSDALDWLKLPGSALGIAPVASNHRVLGRAFTVQFGPVDLVPGTVGDFIDVVPAGAVVVLDSAGRTDCTVWGGILSEVATMRGIAGTVINGVCRDTDVAEALNYALYSRGKFMRTGKDRVEVEHTNTPVSLGDVRVRPGDILIGDGDGIVVVPAEREDEVLSIALRTRDAEQAIVESVRSGKTLYEARVENGYHTLQRG